MKRVIIVVLMAACVGLGWGGIVYAGTDLGQACFQLAGGEVATLRISVVLADGTEAMVGINARWRGIVDASAYQLLGAGTLTESHPADAVLSMGLTFVNPSGAFSENSIAHFMPSLMPALTAHGYWIV